MSVFVDLFGRQQTLIPQSDRLNSSLIMPVDYDSLASAASACARPRNDSGNAISCSAASLNAMLPGSVRAPRRTMTSSPTVTEAMHPPGTQRCQDTSSGDLSSLSLRIFGLVVSNTATGSTK